MALFQISCFIVRFPGSRSLVVSRVAHPPEAIVKWSNPIQRGEFKIWH
jgi:hypothetical protein